MFFKTLFHKLLLALKPKAKQAQLPRIHPRDVQHGEVIWIEWSRIAGTGIGMVKCLSTDPISKRILLLVTWADDEEERLILDYDSKCFDNFHLLNYQQSTVKTTPEQSDIEKLGSLIEAALAEQEYEKVPHLKEKFKKLTGRQYKDA